MIQAKDIKYNKEAREALKNGIDKMANAVKVTLGPRGRNVVIETGYGSPHVTKDGVTVARAIDMANPVEQLGAQMVLQAATQTAEKAGDGTTTSTLLAQEIVGKGFELVEKGCNPMELRKGIDLAVKTVILELDKIKQPIDLSNFDKIASIGSISANNDSEVGNLIADAMKQVGSLGTITIDDSKTNETTISIVDGMQIDRGYISPYFVTTPKMEADYLEPLVLVYDRQISNVKPLVPILEQVSSSGRPLLIIADSVDGDALAALVVNKMQGRLKVVAVKAPGFGDRRKDILEDIAILTGARFICQELNRNLESVQLTDLGTASRIIVGKDYTIISSSKQSVEIKEALAQRVEVIKTQLADCTSDYDKEKLQERLSKLAGGVGSIRVGAASEVELKEKKDLVEDALNATRAAIEEGIVPGGGVAYLRCISALNDLKGANGDQQVGISIIASVLESPARQILLNAGYVDVNKIINIILEEKADFGYDSANEKYCNLIESGVIDPKKVVRIALENASSVAATILTTEATITDVRDEIYHKLHMPPSPMGQ